MLVPAHFFFLFRSIGPQDSTPRVWDNTYFKQTQAQTVVRGVGRFQSDINLGNPQTETGQAFTEFANDLGKMSPPLRSQNINPLS